MAACKDISENITRILQDSVLVETGTQESQDVNQNQAEQVPPKSSIQVHAEHEVDVTSEEFSSATQDQDDTQPSGAIPDSLVPEGLQQGKSTANVAGQPRPMFIGYPLAVTIASGLSSEFSSSDYVAGPPSTQTYIQNQQVEAAEHDLLVPEETTTNETDTTTRILLEPEILSTDGLPDSIHSYKESVHWKRGGMLGKGTFGKCFQARDNKTGTLMCVKQMSFCYYCQSEQEKVTQSVKDEIQMMASLKHPNIVRILGATQQGCHFFMFVEWMSGGSVAWQLDQYGAFSEHVIVNYTQQTLKGLAYLHENCVLHRDLKGANLLIDSTGQKLRLADFGAAVRLTSKTTEAGELQGQLRGTIAFMAPEVLQGESFGCSCDVWSVGCVIIEMFTTKPPWGASAVSNQWALIFKIASTKKAPPIPEDMPPGLKDLALQCLKVKKEERPLAKDLIRHPALIKVQ